MEYRSTNVDRHVHYLGDVVSNVRSGDAGQSSHGVQLTGGSTGASITAAGDEANVTLSIAGKGTGATIIGASPSSFVFGGGSLTLSTGGLLQVGSTAPWAGFLRQTSSFATPNFNTTNAMVFNSTFTFTGVNSSHHVVVNEINLSTDCQLTGGRCGSTVDEVTCRFIKVSTLSVAATTGRVQILVTRY